LKKRDTISVRKAYQRSLNVTILANVAKFAITATTVTTYKLLLH